MTVNGWKVEDHSDWITTPCVWLRKDTKWGDEILIEIEAQDVSVEMNDINGNIWFEIPIDLINEAQKKLRNK